MSGEYKRPCMVRIGGPTGSLEPGEARHRKAPFRPCLLPAARELEVDGRAIPVCPIHRTARHLLHRFTTADIADPAFIEALEQMTERAA